MVWALLLLLGLSTLAQVLENSGKEEFSNLLKLYRLANLMTFLANQRGGLLDLAWPRLPPRSLPMSLRCCCQRIRLSLCLLNTLSPSRERGGISLWKVILHEDDSKMYLKLIRNKLELQLYIFLTFHA